MGKNKPSFQLWPRSCLFITFGTRELWPGSIGRWNRYRSVPSSPKFLDLQQCSRQPANHVYVHQLPPSFFSIFLEDKTQIWWVSSTPLYFMIGFSENPEIGVLIWSYCMVATGFKPNKNVSLWDSYPKSVYLHAMQLCHITKSHALWSTGRSLGHSKVFLVHCWGKPHVSWTSSQNHGWSPIHTPPFCCSHYQHPSP